MISRRKALTSISSLAAIGATGCIGNSASHEEVSTEDALTYANTESQGGYHIEDGIFELEQGQWTAYKFEFVGTPKVDVSLAAEEGRARIMAFPRAEWEEYYRESNREPEPDIRLTNDLQDAVVTTERVSQSEYHMIAVDNTNYLEFEPDGDAKIHLSMGIPF